MVEPGENASNFFKEHLEVWGQTDFRGKDLKQIKLVHPLDRPDRLRLHEKQLQLQEEAPAREALKAVDGHGVLHEGEGQFSDFETESLFEPNRPQHTRRVFHETEIVKDSIAFSRISFRAPK